MYQFLDRFFIVFHSIVILFNLFGWIWSKTRKWNLILLLVTGFFWFGVGIFYGFGYCPLTEWHFQVLYKLGDDPGTTSYVAYFVNRLFGLKIETGIVDIITLVCFLLALGVSIILNFKDRRKIRY